MLVSDLSTLVLETAPPLDPAWLAHEEERKLNPEPAYASIFEKQVGYPKECRELHAMMMAPGARYEHLKHGLLAQELAVPSTEDRSWIPMVQYLRRRDDGTVDASTPETVVVYYHGGGLYVGEADSEDLSCRQIMHAGVPNMTLYSVGYRLLPSHPASTCLSDALDAFRWVRARSGAAARLVIVGSSSGGELAALVSQAAALEGPLAGVLLRSPVTADRASGPEYVPARLRAAHTSVSESFVTPLLGYLRRDRPRDGLARMPLEAAEDQLAGLPRTWIQVCTNDTLFSDGACYAMALRAAGVEVQVDVVEGWPHTFWLKAPQLDRAWEADQAMLDGLRWILGTGEA